MTIDPRDIDVTVEPAQYADGQYFAFASIPKSRSPFGHSLKGGATGPTPYAKRSAISRRGCDGK